MARTIPIVAACAMLLLASLYTAYLVEERARGPSRPGRVPAEATAFRNFTLNTTIPKGPATLATYKIQPAPFSRTWAEELIGSLYPGWINGSEDLNEINMGLLMAHNRKSKNGTNESEIDGIGVGINGLFGYYDNVSFSRWWDVYTDLLMRQNNGTGNGSMEGISIVTREQARSIADRYISDHGGLPAGGFLSCQTRLPLSDKRDELFTEDTDRVVPNHAFLYGRRLDGRFIASNGALVAVTPLGEVFLYAFLWSNATVINRTVKIAPARQALERLDNITGRTGFRIDAIELGYGFNVSEMIWDELRPVWIFYVNRERTSYFFMDAVDLSFDQEVLLDLLP